MMALASFKTAQSVVGLSESPLFYHQYSSVTAAISTLAKTQHELKIVRKIFQEHWLRYLCWLKGSKIHWQTDGVSLFREYSKCLKDTQYIHKANVKVPGNKPVGIGYPLSLVNIADFASSWSVPFEMRRVKSYEDAILVGADQIKEICEREEFKGFLHINACDSSYGTAKYIAQVFAIENLVSVIRLRHGIKVWVSEERKTGGADQIYGEQYYLTEQTGVKKYHKKEKGYEVKQISIYDRKADLISEIEKVTRKGKRLRIELRRWKGLKMRTKNGYSMKEVEFDVVGIRVLKKETGERVFKQDVFVAIVGEERERMSLEECAEEFYHRFDLEVTNRFMKQNLFLQGYETAEVQHLDNWLLIVQEAMWLLWAGSREVEKVSSKWQKYSEPKEEKGGRKTASQTRKGLERLFMTFEKEPFVPQKCKKGIGRQKGEIQEKRLEYKVVKKGKAVGNWTKPSLQTE